MYRFWIDFYCRYHDMALIFGKSNGFLCDMFNYTLNYIYMKTKSLLYFNQRILNQRMDSYCRAVHDAGSPLQYVYGFTVS